MRTRVSGHVLPSRPGRGTATPTAVISEATTKTHVSRVLGRLGLRSRTQAAIAAQVAGPVGAAPSDAVNSRFDRHPRR